MARFWTGRTPIFIVLWLAVNGLLCQKISAAECNGYLVSGPGGVKDSAMTSSSLLYSMLLRYITEPEAGRLFTPSYYDSVGMEVSSWCSKTKYLPTDYIQVEFDSLKTVVAIVTQGKAHSPRYPGYLSYTKSYTVQYSDNGTEWADVLNNTGQPMVFPANNDRDTLVTNYLNATLVTRYIRVLPQSTVGTKCLRLDLIGCDAEPITGNNACVSTSRRWGYVGVVHGEIPGDDVVMETEVDAMLACSRVCYSTDNCSSYSYRQKTAKCVGYRLDNSVQISPPNRSIDLTFPDDYDMFYRHLSAYTKALGFTLNQIQNTRMTRNDAEMECQNRKLTTLMTFTSAPMMTLLQTEIARNLILVHEAGLFVSGSYAGNSTWLYPDGADIPDALWDISGPDPNNGACVMLTPQGLASHSCTDVLFFLCNLL